MASRKLRMSDFEKTLNEEVQLIHHHCKTIFFSVFEEYAHYFVVKDGIYHKIPLRYGTWLRKNNKKTFDFLYITWVNANA
jgi:hypothetical protein